MESNARRYLTSEEIRSIGFQSVGRDVQIASTARIYGAEYMSIGDRTVIDDFCVVSGNLQIGRNVHLAHGCRLIGGREGIVMEDFSGLAFGVTIFAQSDDYTGIALTNPTVPMKFRKISRSAVKLCRHVIVGAGSVVFPGVSIGEGASIGSMSMVTREVEPWSVYFGAPARRIKARKKDMLELERQYLEELARTSQISEDNL
jgi:acetyltransferase-like isoleucine patch superfamily enzyme